MEPPSLDECKRRLAAIQVQKARLELQQMKEAKPEVDAVSVAMILNAADRLRRCPIHGQQPANAWACPECMRELREGRDAVLPRAIEVRRWIENSKHREEGGNPPEFDCGEFVFCIEHVADIVIDALKRWGQAAKRSPDPTALDLLRQTLMLLPGDSGLLQEVGNYLQKFPPCADCGAMTEAEAERTCLGSSADDDCHGCELWPDDKPQSTVDASDRPGCPRELPTAEEVQTWLDVDPDVKFPVFLADPDTPSDDFLAYPAYEVPAIILAALRRWGCDPQFSAEEVAMLAAPWPLLLPPPAPAGSSITNGLEKAQEGGGPPPAPTRDELNDAFGPGPTVEEVAAVAKRLDDARRIQRLRQALREVIACDGLASDEVSDGFLCLAPREVRSLARTAQFAMDRCNRLQTEQKRFRDPERTILCDILANGTLLPDPNGKRYGIPQDAPDLDHASLITFVRNREPWATWLSPGGCLENAHCELTALIMAVLARHGRPVFTPIPIAERLPGPEDCAPSPGEPDSSSWCWTLQISNKFPRGVMFDWVQTDAWDSSTAHFIQVRATHWLPWWAIPIPTTQDSNND